MCASKLCRWLPVAVCPYSLTAGWYRGGVAPVGVDQPQCPGGAGDPGVDNAAVGCEARLGGAVIGGGRVGQLLQAAAVGADGEQVGHDWIEVERQERVGCEHQACPVG